MSFSGIQKSAPMLRPKMFFAGKITNQFCEAASAAIYGQNLVRSSIKVLKKYLQGLPRNFKKSELGLPPSDR
jgi:hypothetical protein